MANAVAGEEAVGSIMLESRKRATAVVEKLHQILDRLGRPPRPASADAPTGPGLLGLSQDLRAVLGEAESLTIAVESMLG